MSEFKHIVNRILTNSYSQNLKDLILLVVEQMQKGGAETS